MQIGALFPEHQQRKEGCGDIWEQYGIQRTEIALKTIRDLNDILPFKIGITIRYQSSVTVSKLLGKTKTVKK